MNFVYFNIIRILHLILHKYKNIFTDANLRLLMNFKVIIVANVVQLNDFAN